jgi:hypothetical protein
MIDCWWIMILSLFRKEIGFNNIQGYDDIVHWDRNISQHANAAVARNDKNCDTFDENCRVL